MALNEKQTIFDPTVLAELGNFRMRAERLADGVTFGEHPSVRMGVSTEFRDHKPWEEGNDPKFIDWRVFARTGKLFQRRFTESTNTVFYFLNDYSKSMEYVGNNEPKRLSKLEYARCVTATMAFAALQQRDLVSLSASNGEKTVSLRASTGENHWTECLKFLENPPFLDGKSQKSPAPDIVFDTFAAACTRRGSIFLLSDFFDVESWEILQCRLRLLAAQKHEITLFHLLDPDEWEFPFTSSHQFVSLESPRESLALSPTNVRAKYIENLRNWQKSIENGCRLLGIHYIRVDTRTPIHQTIFSGVIQ